MKTLTWTPELARQFWQDLAGTEFNKRIAFSRFNAPFLVDLVETHLRSDSLILDFGGGENLYLVRELLRRGFQVAALEPNLAGEDRNRDLYQLENFRGVVVDPAADTYDCVFFSEVIEHLFDDELPVVLGAIARSLKPGALLVMTTPDREDLLISSRYCPSCRHLFHPWGHVRSLSSTDLEKVLAEYGFRCEELHSVDFSENRKPIERARQLQVEIATLACRIEPLLIDLETREAQLAGKLRGPLSRLLATAQEDQQMDPKRRTIGAGGTLVAIARKN